MLYQIAFTIHMLGLIGWGGLTTGAYYLLEFTKIRDKSFLVGYRRLVYVEWGSLLAMALSGVYMWSRLGYPTWVYPAFFMIPVLFLGEIYHWRLTYVDDLNSFLRKMRPLSLIYTVVAIVLIYDMVFKP
ncbi:hypothetical protein [Metallosphaera hakonensis]|uniref:DUF2269 domain-containing protein n=1 Tax=Metallosphaera hakonensis JCM 8857 = DSM 7519 TaxID=1293036 RepID=A0A2U9IR67_9CREN|nr:hypothetical protein [Metallosphaera hakonensis]AWR98505.1 hypothetical protein DFR87_00905 [Metallosphaera hakonensis JCM 8857 = DSM 7519]